jgi:hypothetical protein
MQNPPPGVSLYWLEFYGIGEDIDVSKSFSTEAACYSNQVELSFTPYLEYKLGFDLKVPLQYSLLDEVGACIGDTIDLDTCFTVNAERYAGHEWLTRETGSEEFITISNIQVVEGAAEYFLLLKDLDNCTYTDSIELYLKADCATGIRTNEFRGIKVYPNPNKGQFQVTLPDYPTRWKLKILDLNGNTLRQEEIHVRISSPSHKTLELDYAAGIYLLIIQDKNSGQLFTSPIIIQ